MEDETHNLVGTTFRPKDTKIGNQELENWLATQLSPRIDFNIFECDIEGMYFVLFRIDATRGTPVSFRGIPYIRIGSYKKRLDDHPERERKIWSRATIQSFEREPAMEKVSETNVLSLIDYPAYFDLIKLPLPDNRKGIIERLVEEHIIIPTAHGFTISNLGGLLFAKQIDSFEHLGRKAVRVVQYQGNNRIKTRKEQVGIEVMQSDSKVLSSTSWISCPRTKS